MACQSQIFAYLVLIFQIGIFWKKAAAVNSCVENNANCTRNGDCEPLELFYGVFTESQQCDRDPARSRFRCCTGYLGYCTDNNQCCSGSCGAYSLQLGCWVGKCGCKATGDACESDQDCCIFVTPNGPDVGQACVAKPTDKVCCKEPGTVCINTNECCYGTCTNGECSIPESCVENNGVCDNAAQCCNITVNGVNQPQYCQRISGQPYRCTLAPKRVCSADNQCGANKCDIVSGSFGLCGCKAATQTCAFDYECCSSVCQTTPTSGTTNVCCDGEGAKCTANTDCCSGACVPPPGGIGDSTCSGCNPPSDCCQG